MTWLAAGITELVAGFTGLAAGLRGWTLGDVGWGGWWCGRRALLILDFRVPGNDVVERGDYATGRGNEVGRPGMAPPLRPFPGHTPLASLCLLAPLSQSERGGVSPPDPFLEEGDERRRAFLILDSRARGNDEKP